MRRITSLLAAGGAAALATLSFAVPAQAAAGPFQIRLFGEDASNNTCVSLDPATGNSPDTQLRLAACDRSKTNQLWFFDTLGGSDYHIINVSSFNCMRALRDADRAQVQTIDCTSISDERFSVNVSLPTGAPTQIHARISGGNRCLDATGGGTSPGTPIQVYHCTSNNGSQAFSIL